MNHCFSRLFLTTTAIAGLLLPLAASQSRAEKTTDQKLKEIAALLYGSKLSDYPCKSMDGGLACGKGDKILIVGSTTFPSAGPKASGTARDTSRLAAETMAASGLEGYVFPASRTPHATVIVKDKSPAPLSDGLVHVDQFPEVTALARSLEPIMQQLVLGEDLHLPRLAAPDRRGATPEFYEFSQAVDCPMAEEFRTAGALVMEPALEDPILVKGDYAAYVKLRYGKDIDLSVCKTQGTAEGTPRTPAMAQQKTPASGDEAAPRYDSNGFAVNAGITRPAR